MSREGFTFSELGSLVDMKIEYPGESILEKRFPEFDTFTDSVLTGILLLEDAVRDAGAGELSQSELLKMLEGDATRLLAGINPEWLRKALLRLALDWIPAAIGRYVALLNGFLPAGWSNILDNMIEEESAGLGEL